MAQAVKPACAIGRIWWRQENQDSGKPCTITTSGPPPSTAARRRMSGRSMNLKARTDATIAARQAFEQAWTAVGRIWTG
ncbi:MAG: hypothetical protein WDN03_05655 [Rhizomicrobium sp.]